MRAIKFRAWDKTQKQWLKSIEYNLVEDISMYVGVAFCQFTGLKDKNGKDVYEGDILRWNDKKFPEITDFCVIEWLGEIAAFTLSRSMRLETYGGHDLQFFCETESLVFEVIGNIWENSELLK